MKKFITFLLLVALCTIAVQAEPTLYLRGDMNNWEADPAWSLTEVEDNLWSFTCTEDQSITPGENFKIADAIWGRHIIGTDENPLIEFNTVTNLIESVNPSYMVVDDVFTGILWLKNDEGTWKLAMSNDKTYIPDWNSLPNPPGPGPDPEPLSLTVNIADGPSTTTSGYNGEPLHMLLDAPQGWKISQVLLNGDDCRITSTPAEVDIYFNDASVVIDLYLDYDGEIIFVDAESGIVEISNTITIAVEDGEIVIKGCQNGDIVTIYNMGAQIIDRHIASEDTVRCRLPKSIYIVCINDIAAKVAL